MKTNQLLVLLASFSALTAAAQVNGETVQLTNGAYSSFCPNGAALVRANSGYPASTTAYTVPACWRLEVTDLQYDLNSHSSPRYTASVVLSSVDKATGQSIDQLWHRHSFDEVYKKDQYGRFVYDEQYSAKPGSYHVSWASGIQMTNKTQLCLSFDGTPNRFGRVSLRGRLVYAPTPNCSTATGSTSTSSTTN